MARLRLSIGFALLVWIAAPARISAGAQGQAAGPDASIGLTVTDVRFDVEGRPDTSGVLAANVEIRKGQPLRLEDIRGSIVRLSSKFDGISVTGERTAGGVDIIFHLTPRHPINAVQFEFTGPSDISATDLAERFRRAYGSLPSNERVPNAEIAVRRLLAELGYLDAVVTSTTVPTHENERATLVFNVTLGEPIRVGAVTVTNRSPWTDATVLERAGVAEGGVYRQRDVQTAMASLQEELRSSGYYEAVATVSTERRAVDGHEAVTIAVEAGAKVELRFAGDPLPSAVGHPDELVPLKREGAADDDLLESSRVRIETRLKSAGYREGRATYTRAPLPDGAIGITFTISRGPRYRIDRVDLPAQTRVPLRTLEEALNLKAGDPFSESRTTVGAARVQIEYQRLGYFDALVQADTENVVGRMQGDDALVIIHLKITEGRRHVISAIPISYSASPAQIPEADLRARMRSLVNGPYVSAEVARDAEDLQNLYLDRGYRAAVVTVRPQLQPAGDEVHVTLNVLADEGPQIMVGSITIVGNNRFSEATVREDLTLREGAPFGEAARVESLNALVERGIFRRVTIEEEARLSGETQASVVVSVEELPANTLGYGGGLEVGRKPTSTGTGLIDNLEFAPRGFFEVGRRTLGGRDRSVNLFTRAALKRRNVPEDPTVPVDPGYSLSEYRVTGTYRERRAFDTNTELLVGFTAEQGVRTNFNFVRQAANIEALWHLTSRMSLSGRYALDFTELFDEQIQPEDQFSIDRLFPQVRLSILGTAISWDTRNSAIAPTRGVLVSTNFEVALKKLGSQVGYVKNFFQISSFRALPIERRRTVLAGRVEFGVAHGFQSVPAIVQRIGLPVLGPDGLPLVQPVSDLPASQRFFAGGGGTVRGFQIDLLGVPEILTTEGLSNGGNAVVVLNGEVRTLIRKLGGRDLVGVAFADGGNVFRRAVDLDLGQLRGSLGVGVRYDSPIGPVRIDFGFKTNRLVFTSGQRERGWEYHLSIGEAF